MVILKRKTKKKLTKQLSKVVKKHGSEIAIGLATGIVTNLITNNVGEDSQKSASTASKKSRDALRNEGWRYQGYFTYGC
jgi:hypothetical protein